MKVDFIIAGGQKCGTTALHYFLSQHPKVLVSSPKEIDFFNYDFQYNKGPKYYHSFFKKRPFLHKFRNFKFLEASPSYINGSFLSEPTTTAQRIYNYNPNVKIIVLLRNPIDRAFSAWNMCAKRYKEGKVDWWMKWFKNKTNLNVDVIRRSPSEYDSFLDFITSEMNTLKLGKNIECPVLENGEYIKFLNSFKDVFKENFYVLKNEDLDTQTVQELENIGQFMNLSFFDWSSFKNEKVFKGDYNDIMGNDEFQLLYNYYKVPNEKLLKEYGINYL